MYSNSEGEDTDDEWFYSSFKRYDDLLMYNVQGSISSMALKGNSKLLLASSRDHHREISELSLPKKIIAGKDSGLTRDRDFSVMSAGYTAGVVKRMLPLEAGVVTSESTGVYFYFMPNQLDKTDIITLNQSIKKGAGNFPVAATDLEVYYGINIEDFCAFDLSSSTSHKVSLFSDDVDMNSKSISELCLKNGNLYICLEKSGSILIYDPRNKCSSQKGIYNDPSEGKWTLDVSNNGHYIATLSSNGTLRLLDSRNIRKFVYTKDFEVQEEFRSTSAEFICVRICPQNNFVSVSGMNRNVQILNIDEIQNDSYSFNHDGHRDEEVKNISTHIWHPVQENLVFSADNTGQLQAWRFKGS